MAQFIYTMNRVSKVVPPKRTILRDISLSFFPGAKIGVLGLNGAGKSSLLRIMAGVDREHDGVVPTGDDRAHFECLPVPLALWRSFEECLSDHLSELSEGQIDRDERFWFEAAHVNAMIAVVEAEAVAAAPELRDWLISLVAFARRAADRHVGLVFVMS